MVEVCTWKSIAEKTRRQWKRHSDEQFISKPEIEFKPYMYVEKHLRDFKNQFSPNYVHTYVKVPREVFFLLHMYDHCHVKVRMLPFPVYSMGTTFLYVMPFQRSLWSWIPLANPWSLKGYWWMLPVRPLSVTWVFTKNQMYVSKELRPR
jgi:hypothetical protein